MDNKIHRIIIIEDDKTMLSLLRTLLQMEGFDVVSVEADSLDGMFSTVLTEQPDLALIDVHLHDINGFDLLARIRQNENLNKMRVIMSSGMDFRTECLNKGADEFILKPYMPDDLISLIRQMVKV
jgi:DNA-binding response OmpR family regulator